MTHHISISAVALVFALAACSSDDSPAVGERADTAQAGGSMDAAEVADKARRASERIKPEPGQYRVTVEEVALDIPGAPKGAAEMMAGAMGQGRTSEYCLTQADVDKGYEEMAKRSQDASCTYQRFDVSGGKIDAAMTCKGEGGSTVNAVMSGTAGRTSSTMDMTMDMEMPGMGKGTMRMKSRHERIGDCPA